jgi:pimeloyl-ACP methyl ester carboxylesterase
MFAACKVRLAIVVGLLLSSSLAAQDKAEKKETPVEKTAKAFVTLLSKGDFDKAIGHFDEAMLKALPADKLKGAWEKVAGDAGDFKKQLSSRVEKSGKYDAVIVTCEFRKKKMDARVVFDKDGKITGLFFKPPAPTGKEEIFEGTLKVGGIELRLVFHLFKQTDGTYQGTMDSPDQGAKGILLDEVSVKDDAVRLELKSSKMVYEGKRDKDGKKITGNLKQGGQTFPLALEKVAKAKETRRPQTPKKPYPYDEIEVAYENKKGGVKLAGTLTVPRSGGPFPAVLLITGSGPQDRDETIFGHKPFLVLADYLSRRGIAVLRVDDRGVGGSTGKTSESTSADFAGDVHAGVEFLKGRKEINASQIGLIGHSEGGIIAPLVASRSKDVAFIVLLAGTGLPGDEILYLQGAAILKANGADAEMLAKQKAIQTRMFAIVREEKDRAAAEKKLRAALDEIVSKMSKEEKKQGLESLGGPSAMEGQVQMVLTPWFRHFLDYDPRPALRKVSCPVLALNGEKDVQVPAEVNLKAIAAALKEAGNKDVTTVQLPNLNHLFQTCKTGSVTEYAAIEETLAPVALETIANWITKRTRGKGGK